MPVATVYVEFVTVIGTSIMGVHTAIIPIINESAQSYQLHIRLNRSIKCQIGCLGHFHFPAGKYLYTGSAQHNMAARLSRHLQKDKRLRWHIDYLLNSCYAHIFEIWVFSESECALNQKLAGEVLVAGFGSSDCKQGCGSHLKFMG